MARRIETLLDEVGWRLLVALIRVSTPEEHGGLAHLEAVTPTTALILSSPVAVRTIAGPPVSRLARRS